MSCQWFVLTSLFFSTFCCRRGFAITSISEIKQERRSSFFFVRIFSFPIYRRENRENHFVFKCRRCSESFHFFFQESHNFACNRWRCCMLAPVCNSICLLFWWIEHLFLSKQNQCEVISSLFFSIFSFCFCFFPWNYQKRACRRTQLSRESVRSKQMKKRNSQDAHTEEKIYFRRCWRSILVNALAQSSLTCFDRPKQNLCTAAHARSYFSWMSKIIDQKQAKRE